MKGDISWVGRLLAVMLITIMVLQIGLNIGEAIDDKIRIETIDIVGQRFGTAIYMISGVENGSVQLNLQKEYGLNKKKLEEGETPLVNYTAGSLPLSILQEYGEAPIRTPVDFSMEPGRDKEFCIRKKSNEINLRPGECNQ